MFDIGWTEILVIVVVAIVVVGPKDLPPMLRAAGRMVSRLRKTAGEFQGQFNEALREAELDGVKESIDQLRGLNPMNEIKKSLDPISAALSSPTAIAKPAPEPVPPKIGQAAQPATDADIEPAPAAPPMPTLPAATVDGPAPIGIVPKSEAAVAAAVAVPVEGVAEDAAAPKRVRKPKAPAVTADAEVAEAPKAAKPRARKPKAADAVPAEAVSVAAGHGETMNGEAGPMAKPDPIVPESPAAAAVPASEERSA